MKKKNKKIIHLFFSVLALIVSTFIVFLFYYYPAQEFILSSLYEEDTVYAKGYRDTDWKSIKVGEQLSAIEKLLGNPLNKAIDRNGMLRYYYTKQGNNKAYRVRILVFNDDQVLKEKIEDYYLD